MPPKNLAHVTDDDWHNFQVTITTTTQQTMERTFDTWRIKNPPIIPLSATLALGFREKTLSEWARRFRTVLHAHGGSSWFGIQMNQDSLWSVISYIIAKRGSLVPEKDDAPCDVVRNWQNNVASALLPKFQELSQEALFVDDVLHKVKMLWQTWTGDRLAAQHNSRSLRRENERLSQQLALWRSSLQTATQVPLVPAAIVSSASTDVAADPVAEPRQARAVRRVLSDTESDRDVRRGRMSPHQRAEPATKRGAKKKAIAPKPAAKKVTRRKHAESSSSSSEDDDEDASEVDDDDESSSSSSEEEEAPTPRAKPARRVQWA
jgi:hypothetical protein